MKKYNIIYADPPWDFKVWSVKTSQRPWHYPRMSHQELLDLPIATFADKDCGLFLWVTSPNLLEGLDLIAHWGFQYKTIVFVWTKLNTNNMGFAQGLGYWTRANAEFCILATKGKPKRKDKGIPQILATPRMRHSRKPDIIRERIVQLMGDLPRVELFARQKVDGWDSWGNEVDSDIEL